MDKKFMEYMNQKMKKMAFGGNVNPDETYRDYQSYVSSGEPEADGEEDETHPMSYMSGGGIMDDVTKLAPLAMMFMDEGGEVPEEEDSEDPSEPDSKKKKGVDYSGEVYKPVMMNDQFAFGGKIGDQEDEDEDDQESPDMSHEEQADNEDMPRLAFGGKIKNKMSKGGLAGKMAFAKALKRG